MATRRYKVRNLSTYKHRCYVLKNIVQDFFIHHSKELHECPDMQLLLDSKLEPSLLYARVSAAVLRKMLTQSEKRGRVSSGEEEECPALAGGWSRCKHFSGVMCACSLAITSAGLRPGKKTK
eukprot:1968999-Pyramimonas_sp.AAC.1